MKIPKTVQLNHPALYVVAEPVKPEQCKELAAALDRAMRKADYPAGLALPQLGISLQGFMINGRMAAKPPYRHRYCFNPEISYNEAAGTSLQPEQCLSLPGQTYYVSRYLHIVAKYRDEDGRLLEEEFRGKLARIFLHESDHLFGILISDPSRARTPKLDADMQPMRVQDTASTLISSVMAAGIPSGAHHAGI